MASRSRKNLPTSLLGSLLLASFGTPAARYSGSLGVIVMRNGPDAPVWSGFPATNGSILKCQRLSNESTRASVALFGGIAEMSVSTLGAVSIFPFANTTFPASMAAFPAATVASSAPLACSPMLLPTSLNTEITASEDEISISPTPFPASMTAFPAATTVSSTPWAFSFRLFMALSAMDISPLDGGGSVFCASGTAITTAAMDRSYNSTDFFGTPAAIILLSPIKKQLSWPSQLETVRYASSDDAR